MPKRKRLTAGQKAQIVLEAIREDKSVALIATENNIHPTQIHKWKKQALENLPKLFEKARFYPFWPLEPEGDFVVFDQVLEEYQRFLKA